MERFVHLVLIAITAAMERIIGGPKLLLFAEKNLVEQVIYVR